jgi:hypothetical protein
MADLRYDFLDNDYFTTYESAPKVEEIELPLGN